jgi:hypothetical protein
MAFSAGNIRSENKISEGRSPVLKKLLPRKNASPTQLPADTNIFTEICKKHLRFFREYVTIEVSMQYSIAKRTEYRRKGALLCLFFVSM